MHFRRQTFKALRFIGLDLLLISLALLSTSTPVYGEPINLLEQTNVLAEQAVATTSLPGTEIPKTLPGGKSLESLANFEKFFTDFGKDMLEHPEWIQTWLQTTVGLTVAIVVTRELYAFFKTDSKHIINAWKARRKMIPVNKLADTLFDQLGNESQRLILDAENFWETSSKLESLRRQLINEMPAEMDTNLEKALGFAYRLVPVPPTPSSEIVSSATRKELQRNLWEKALEQNTHHIVQDERFLNWMRKSKPGAAWLEQWEKTQNAEERKELALELWDGMAFKKAAAEVKNSIALRTPIEQAKAFSENQNIRRELKKSTAGKNWLESWDHSRKVQEAAQENFFTTFHRSAALTKNFYERLNEASDGWLFRNKALRTHVPEITIAPARAGDIAAVASTNDLGGAPKYNDPRDLPHEYSNVLRKSCRAQFHKLTGEWEEHGTGLAKAAIRFGGLATIGGLGVGSYLQGRTTIVREYKAEPTQIIENQKKNEAQETAKIAFEATSPARLAQKIRDWRKDPQNTHSQKIFSVFHKQIADNLPSIADNLRMQMIDKVGREKFDTAAFDMRVQELIHSPEKLEGVVELALADASVSEGKLTEVLDLENLLLADPKELPKDVQRDQVINYSFGIAPKYLWPLLINDRTTYPVDFSIINPMLKNTKTAIESLRREKIAAQATQPPQPKPASVQAGLPLPLPEDAPEAQKPITSASTATPVEPEVASSN